MRNYEGISLDRALTDLILILVDKRGSMISVAGEGRL